MDKLFSAKKIKNIEIKNRIVFPPIARFGWSDDSGEVSEDHLKSYEMIARGGCGLIIIEALSVLKEARVTNPQLGIWSDKHIEGLRKIAESCHRNGAKVIAQIGHGGFKASPEVSKGISAPSNYNYYGTIAFELSLPEIKYIQDSFITAAERVKEAGLDGIELHGAHGFLIGQFMSPITNRRTDMYGGNIANRARFAVGIIDKLKDNIIDNNFILGYRLGANEPSLYEGIEIANILDKAGVDLLHVSHGLEGGSIPNIPQNFNFSWIVYCGIEIKKHVNVPVIAVNGIKLPEQARYLIENNLADFAAVGKAQLCDPFWALKAKNNQSIDRCLRCNMCSWMHDGKNCPAYSNVIENYIKMDRACI